MRKKNTFVSNNSCSNENPQKVNLCSKPEGNPLSLRHLFFKIPKMLSGEIIHNIALQHKLVLKFTSTIYWKKCLDILMIEKGLHGDWNGNPCFPTTALFNGRSYWRDAKWSLTFPETSRWWLSCHSWQGRGEARPKRFRHPTSRQETLHYPRQSGGIATQKGFQKSKI